jgi:hypothetical protein
VTVGEDFGKISKEKGIDKENHSRTPQQTALFCFNLLTKCVYVKIN